MFCENKPKTKRIKIDEVQVGMKIKTQDEGKTVFKTVTDKFDTVVEQEEQVFLTFENGVTLHCSTNHPIMVMRDGVVIEVKPIDLTSDDMVISEYGATRMRTIDVGQYNDTRYVDITVEDTHTFFAANELDGPMVLTHNSQGGIRNAACTITYPIWHYEFEDLIVLKNNQGTEENRVRHMDYSVGMSAFFWKRFTDKGVITFFDPSQVPDLYVAFHANPIEFARLYNHYEANAKELGLRTKQKSAEEVIVAMLITERTGTGRIYIINIDNANAQGPLDPSIHPIYQSNLCFSGDTLVAVADGRNAVRMEDLVGTGEFDVYSAVKSGGKSTVRGTRGGGSRQDSEWKYVVRKARAIKTGQRELVRIHLEDGDYFDATPDHRLATTKFGGWVEAGDSLGVALEPFATFANGRLVVRIEQLPAQDCFDIQVIDVGLTDDEHNFYIITSHSSDFRESKGVLVHNCQEIFLHTNPLGRITKRRIRVKKSDVTTFNNDTPEQFKRLIKI